MKEIKHANIPRLLDHGKWEGYLWLAMPTFLPLHVNIPLEGKLERVEMSDVGMEGYPKKAKSIPLELRQKIAVEVLSDIGQVIAYISGTGIVHADISPWKYHDQKRFCIES